MLWLSTKSKGTKNLWQIIEKMKQDLLFLSFVSFRKILDARLANDKCSDNAIYKEKSFQPLSENQKKF